MDAGAPAEVVVSLALAAHGLPLMASADSLVALATACEWSGATERSGVVDELCKLTTAVVEGVGAEGAVLRLLEELRDMGQGALATRLQGAAYTGAGLFFCPGDQPLRAWRARALRLPAVIFVHVLRRSSTYTFTELVKLKLAVSWAKQHAGSPELQSVSALLEDPFSPDSAPASGEAAEARAASGGDALRRLLQLIRMRDLPPVLLRHMAGATQRGKDTSTRWVPLLTALECVPREMRLAIGRWGLRYTRELPTAKLNRLMP